MVDEKMVSKRSKRSRKDRRKVRWTRPRVRGSRWKDGYLLADVSQVEVGGVGDAVLLQVV